jgi:hypothetical protein
MPQVGFEPITPAFEMEKAVLAFDCAATVIGELKNSAQIVYTSHNRCMSVDVEHKYDGQ